MLTTLTTPFAYTAFCISILVGLTFYVPRRFRIERARFLRHHYEGTRNRALRDHLERMEKHLERRLTPMLAEYLINDHVKEICGGATVSADSIQDEDHCCQICWEPLKAETEILDTIDDATDQDRLIQGRFCRHVFHENCLRPWIVSHKTSCPLCRKNLFPGFETRTLELLQFTVEAVQAREAGTLLSTSVRE